MSEKFTSEIYSDWMKTTQEKKYREVFLEFVLPLKQKMDLNRSTVLDIGIGKGWFEKKLFESGVNSEVIGLDIEKMDLATEGVDFLLASGDHLPFKDEHFDLVVCFDTIHLLKRPQELERVLKEDGYALISIFCNERNLKEKKEKVKSMLDLRIVKECLVGDPEKEISQTFLMKKGP